MEWWTLLVAAATYVGTKAVDHFFAIAKEKRDFRKHRREKAFAEIEELKDEVGRMYELASNWNSYDGKLGDYAAAFAKDFALVGKYNKYPQIAVAARDAVHWCKVVASCEKEHRDELIQNKKELAEKHRTFLQACEKYVESLV